MHAVTREGAGRLVAVPTPDRADARGFGRRKLNLRAEGPEVRTARRAVAAYLTACGVREPDVVAKHTSRIVTEVVETALLAERRVPEDLADRALGVVASEYLAMTRDCRRDAPAKCSAPSHNRAILGALPEVWERHETAVGRACDYVAANGLVVVPAESPRRMATADFADGRPTPLERCRPFVEKALRARRFVVATMKRLIGERPGVPQAS